MNHFVQNDSVPYRYASLEIETFGIDFVLSFNTEFMRVNDIKIR